jgi:peroxiredoxin Q/BCP
MNSSAAWVGKPAPDFKLQDQDGKYVKLADLTVNGPVLLAFYPGDFRLVCTRQFCDYRDRMDDFKSLGVQVVGISADRPDEHKRFAAEYKFTFPLLFDPGRGTAKAYNCVSLMMLGNQSRAVFIVGRDGIVLYRYVEPTVISRRNSDDLVGVLKGLREQGVL